MFLGNLYLFSRPNPVQFIFSSRQSAMEAGQQPDEADIYTIIDDYGQCGRFQRTDVCGWLVIDFKQVVAGEIEKNVITSGLQRAAAGPAQNVVSLRSNAMTSETLPQGEA